MNMMKFLPPRLRAPVSMIVGGSVITVIGVILNGWVAAAFLIPFAVICTVWYYVLGGGDSDLAAVFLGQGDTSGRSGRQVHASGFTAGWPGCRLGRRRTRAWRPGCR